MFFALVSILGGAFLIWYYYIDGVYVNKIIEYRQDIDPMNFELDKYEYKRGEIPNRMIAYCKHRQAIPTTQWALSNPIKMVTIYPPRTYDLPDRGNDLGCRPEDSSKLPTPMEIILDDVPTGCGYYFTGSVTREFGGGRTETQALRTQNFCVID